MDANWPGKSAGVPDQPNALSQPRHPPAKGTAPGPLALAPSSSLPPPILHTPGSASSSSASGFRFLSEVAQTLFG